MTETWGLQVRQVSGPSAHVSHTRRYSHSDQQSPTGGLTTLDLSPRSHYNPHELLSSQSPKLQWLPHGWFWSRRSFSQTSSSGCRGVSGPQMRIVLQVRLATWAGTVAHGITIAQAVSATLKLASQAVTCTQGICVLHSWESHQLCRSLQSVMV